MPKDHSEATGADETFERPPILPLPTEAAARLSTWRRRKSQRQRQPVRISGLSR